MEQETKIKLPIVPDMRQISEITFDPNKHIHFSESYVDSVLSSFTKNKLNQTEDKDN
jgi:hypothetical protein